MIENTSVDFYSPLLKKVIEIDGKQHNESNQKSTDNTRDKELKRMGVSITRISLADPNFEKINNNNLFQEKIIKKEDLKLIDIYYLYIFRFQIALLFAIEHGYLDIKKII